MFVSFSVGCFAKHKLKIWAGYAQFIRDV